jgi:hypothetical protein
MANSDWTELFEYLLLVVIVTFVGYLAVIVVAYLSGPTHG